MQAKSRSFFFHHRQAVMSSKAREPRHNRTYVRNSVIWFGGSPSPPRVRDSAQSMGRLAALSLPSLEFFFEPSVIKHYAYSCVAGDVEHVVFH